MRDRRLLWLAMTLAIAGLLLWFAFVAEPAPAPAPGGAHSGAQPAALFDPVHGETGRTDRAQSPPDVAPAERQALPVAALPAGLPPDPRIRGQLSRAGRLLGNREVHVVGAPFGGRFVVLTATTDALGQYDFELPGAGNYRVRAAWENLRLSIPANLPLSQIPRTAAAERAAQVLKQAVHCDLMLPLGVLHLTARDAQTRLPLPEVEVALRWPDGLDLIGATDQDGELLAADLPAGLCTVSLALRGYRAPPPFTFDASVHVLEQRELVLEPACALEVAVRNERGRAVACDLVPYAVAVDTGTGATQPPRPFYPLLGRNPPRVLQFDLLPGCHEVRIVDPRGSDNGDPTVCFRSYEAVSPCVVEIARERAARAELTVARRGYVEFSATSKSGSSGDLALRVDRLDIRDGILRALPSPAPWAREATTRHLFAGYLAPGTYWLTFTGPRGAVHRETLQMERSNVRRAFRMPW